MRVLVTGVSLGIGGAICTEIVRNVKEKAQIAICVRKRSKEIDGLVQTLERAGAKIIILVGNLLDPLAPADFVEKTVAAFGGLDCVISNAGGVDPKPLLALQAESFDRLMKLNCFATLLLAQASYPHLKESRGALVAMSSAAGIQPATGSGAYSVSKAALSMLCRQLAMEWAEHGIRVNVVSPGLVRTPINDVVFQNEDIMRQRKELIPLHIIGTPFDIARAVWYFASPENNYSTGQDLLVDGGLCGSILTHIPGAPPPKS